MGVKKVYKVEAEVYELREQNITILKLEDVLYYQDVKRRKFTPQPKESTIVKWARLHKKTIINLEEFYLEYPQYKRAGYKRRTERILSKLIDQKKILQLSATKFKVIEL